MIYDYLKNLGLYRNLSPNMNRAIDFVLSTPLDSLPLGITEIDGKNVYINVMVAQRKAADTLLFEDHYEYIDLQIGAIPGETIGYLPASFLNKWEDRPKEDCRLAYEEQPGLLFPLAPDRFFILFPQDAHKPGIGTGEGKKYVLKVKI